MGLGEGRSAEEVAASNELVILAVPIARPSTWPESRPARPARAPA